VGAAVEAMARLVDAARAAGVPVVWVELATQQMSWTSDNWLRQGARDLAMGDARPCLAGTPGAAWFGPLSPAEGELRVRKDAYSGFVRTDLDARLRAAGIDWLVVGGLTTECCVLSTVNDAMQHDWQVLVAADATAAYSSSLHRAGLDLMALNAAVLSDVDEVRSLMPVSG
ncbi:MAG: isochorismatase family cysteine hydrolase, partial [Nocardioides sp.]|uniref:cysteine hydrolase family protein n=1 Tax=Nocardioides sp. TaxID=35761 RepID=UPI0039E5D284